MLYTWAEVPYAAVASICVSGMMIYGTYCLLSVVPDADVISIGGIALLMILLFVTSLLVLSRVIHAVLSVFVMYADRDDGHMIFTNSITGLIATIFVFALFFTTHSVWWSGTSDGILHISDPIAGVGGLAPSLDNTDVPMLRPVRNWLESTLSLDSLPLQRGEPTFRTKWQMFLTGISGPLRHQGNIAPPDDDDQLEILTIPWAIPAELNEDVFHWSHLIAERSTQKALWITVTRNDKIDICAYHAHQLLSSGEGMQPAILVDVSKTESVFWPLLYGLGTSMPDFREELACIPQFQLRGVEILEYYSQKNDHVERLILSPLIWTMRQMKNSGRDPEGQENRNVALGTVIIHGIRNGAQANEAYSIIEALGINHQDHRIALDIVAISSPQLFCEVAEGAIAVMEHVYTLAVPETGSIIYSAKPPALPPFYQGLFRLALQRIYRTGGNISARLSELRALSSPDISTDSTLSIKTIFNALHNASENCKQMIQFLSDLPVISESEIQTTIWQDSVGIARILQHMFRFKSYKHDIPMVPEEEAFSVLNLTHRILDRGLPENDVIWDADRFKQCAHRLLHILADFLNILPEELAIHGVILMNDRAVKSGGFADIYHGQYTNANGEQVEVALKVLRIFRDPSYDGPRVLQKFAKEALVWHYLKHPNILPFLGVDGATFPAPRMAMVSPWMQQGSVLNYMSENSPVSRYAINLLDDVIQGLKYLHSENIAHGDLCGRNILINERRAYLTDFGLTGFVQSETSAKTSTHGGSMRWMAPELIHPDIHQPNLPFKRTPASDVWAFGCVCCEIWTEGEIPFARMSEGTLILALSRLDADDVVPYNTKSCDKAGTPMPDPLWELVRLCFKHKATARPDISVIANMLSEMKLATPGATDAHKTSAVSTSSAAPRAGRLQMQIPLPPSRIVDGEHATGSCISTSAVYGNGTQPVRLEPHFWTVRFGPIDLDREPEALFHEILDGLLNTVRRDVLICPRKVEKHGDQCIDLQFQSVLEAHSFAMTWKVYRYDPYKDVEAVLVDDDSSE